MTAQPELELPDGEQPTSDPTTAKALVEVLRRHYLRDERHPAGIFAPGIQAPGGSLRKADLIWLGCTAAAGSELVGHEIKISRADLQRELADLTKSDPWQRYCNRWWLVIPHPQIITGLQLPSSWGVMRPPTGKRARAMTIHTPAPALTPDEQAPALRTLAGWVHWRHRDLQHRLKDVEDRLERAERNARETQLVGRQREDPGHQLVARIVTELGGTWMGDTIGDWRRNVKPEDVVLALRDLAEVYAKRDEIERALDMGRGNLETAGRFITNALGAMDAAIADRK